MPGRTRLHLAAGAGGLCRLAVRFLRELRDQRHLPGGELFVVQFPCVHGHTPQLFELHEHRDVWLRRMSVVHVGFAVQRDAHPVWPPQPGCLRLAAGVRSLFAVAAVRAFGGQEERVRWDKKTSDAAGS